MITKIDNDADYFATLQSCDLDENSTISWPKLLATIANVHCPIDEDFEIIIRLRMLPESYRTNVSQLARVAVTKSDSFQSYGTYTLSSTHIGIKFTRDEKEGRHHFVPPDRQSPNLKIRQWLQSEESQEPKAHMMIPIDSMPESFQSRPEQLTYRVFRETGIRIRIQKTQKFYKITVKQNS